MRHAFIWLTIAAALVCSPAWATLGTGIKAVKLLDAATTVAAGSGQGKQNFVETRTFQAIVAGTGTVTATVLVQCSMDNSNWVTLGTLTLSGTTSDTAAFTSNSACAYHRGNVTAISGTGAAVTLYQGGG